MKLEEYEERNVQTCMIPLIAVQLLKTQRTLGANSEIQI